MAVSVLTGCGKDNEKKETSVITEVENENFGESKEYRLKGNDDNVYTITLGYNAGNYIAQKSDLSDIKLEGNEGTALIGDIEVKFINPDDTYGTVDIPKDEIDKYIIRNE